MPCFSRHPDGRGDPQRFLKNHRVLMTSPPYCCCTNVDVGIPEQNRTPCFEMPASTSVKNSP